MPHGAFISVLSTGRAFVNRTSEKGGVTSSDWRRLGHVNRRALFFALCAIAGTLIVKNHEWRQEFFTDPIFPTGASRPSTIQSSAPLDRLRVMRKQTKTAAELEAMILSEMLDLAECPDGMCVSVKPVSDSWEALTLSPNQVSYAECVARVTLIAARLKQRFALATESLPTAL